MVVVVVFVGTTFVVGAFVVGAAFVVVVGAVVGIAWITLRMPPTFSVGAVAVAVVVVVGRIPPTVSVGAGAGAVVVVGRIPPTVSVGAVARMPPIAVFIGTIGAGERVSVSLIRLEYLSTNGDTSKISWFVTSNFIFIF